jgi:hypothetical protein
LVGTPADNRLYDVMTETTKVTEGQQTSWCCPQGGQIYRTNVCNNVLLPWQRFSMIFLRCKAKTTVQIKKVYGPFSLITERSTKVVPNHISSGHQLIFSQKMGSVPRYPTNQFSFQSTN